MAIVTGGGSGIGRAITYELLTLGMIATNVHFLNNTKNDILVINTIQYTRFGTMDVWAKFICRLFDEYSTMELPTAIHDH